MLRSAGVRLRPLPLHRLLTDDIDERTASSRPLSDSVNVRPDPCELQLSGPCAIADAEDPGLRDSNGFSMPSEAEMVSCQQDSARFGLLDDPYVVVEGLFDGRAVGLPEGDDLESHRAESSGDGQTAEAPVDEELGEPVRRLLV